MPRKPVREFDESVALAVRDADERHRLLRAAARVAQGAIDSASSEGALVIDVIHILQDHVTRISQVPDTDEQPEQHEPETNGAVLAALLDAHNEKQRLFVQSEKLVPPCIKEERGLVSRLEAVILDGEDPRQKS